MMDIRNVKSGQLCLVVTDTSRFVKSTYLEDIFPLENGVAVAKSNAKRGIKLENELVLLKKGAKIVFIKFGPMSEDRHVWLSWFVSSFGTVVYRHQVISSKILGGIDADWAFTIPQLEAITV